jgi:hypothetical protein
MLRDSVQQLRAVEQTLSADPGLGIFGGDTGSWIKTQRMVEEAFARANTEIKEVVDISARAATSLQAPVSKALALAIRERQAAHLKVFGVPEPRFPEAVSLEPRETPRVKDNFGATEPSPVLLRHAFEVLTLRATESEGYGAYTYVILPVRESAAPEYRALLTAIVNLTPAASSNASPLEKRGTNLFIIPGKSADPIESKKAPEYVRDIRNYDWSRALSLVQTASAGVLTTSAVLKRFQRSPGPFLLTLPVPIERATGVTRLLLADLRGYPRAGFQDLVKSYQNELVRAFPTGQRLWRPPWRQAVALTLVRIGAVAGGQNFVALIK